MTRLSVNINKIALIRNSRGGNLPDLVQMAKDCESFGAQGITVHPRPDERHVKYSDIPLLKQAVTADFNIEGYPDERFMALVLAYVPDQCTLVPDPPGVLTSDRGWDTGKDSEFLQRVILRLKKAGIRVSLFVNADPAMVEGAARTGADRIELYTGDYARSFDTSPDQAILPHIHAAGRAQALGLGVNAGHDLNLANLRYYRENVPGLLEVSIGHALICNALYYGYHNAIQMYLAQLK